MLESLATKRGGGNLSWLSSASALKQDKTIKIIKNRHYENTKVT